MPKNRTLNEKQIRFVELLVWNKDGLSAAECAAKAGYTTRPRQSASELRNPRLYPQVVELINKERAERAERYKVTKDNHVERLDNIGRKAETKNQFSAAITAEHYRGKVAGLYVDKSLQLTGSIDRMGKESLLKALDQIKTKYAMKTEEDKPKIESSPSSE